MNKTKKRIFTAITSIVLAFTMVFAVACGGNDDTTVTPDTPATDTPLETLRKEYVNTYSEITMDAWLLKVMNSAVLETDATAVTYSGNTVTATISDTPTEYSLEVTDGNLVFGNSGVTTTVGVYKVDVKDQHENVVKDVCLRITWYDSSEPITVTYDKNYSNAEGKAIFYAPIVTGRTYRIQTQDLSLDDVVTPDGVTTPLPLGYSIPADTYGFRTGIVSFGDSMSMTYKLDYFPSDFDSAISKQYHSYARYAFGVTNDGEFGAGALLGTIQERNEDLALEIKSGVYSYVGVSPFIEPGAGDVTGLSTPQQNAQIDARKVAADNASVGKYSVTLDTTDSTARLVYFSSTFTQNEEGVPTNIGAMTGTGSEAYYTGTNSITINARLYNNDNRSTFWFGVVSDNDCNATIKVARIGEAEEPTAATVHDVTPTANLTAFAAPSGTVNDMPINGIYTAVLGSDGYYHVNKADGLVLYVNLTRSMSRVFAENTITISNLPTTGNRGDYIFMFNERNDPQDPTAITDTYNYVNFIESYSRVADTRTGLYPVTAEMKVFLERLAGSGVGSCISTAAQGSEWLSYCQYIGETEAPGSGTQAAPFLLTTGANNVTIGASGTIYMSITLNAGVYGFASSSSSATLAYADGTLPAFDNNGTLMITVYETGTTLNFTLAGTAGEYTVSVSTTNVIESTLESDQGALDSGVSAETAIVINMVGTYNVVTYSESNPDNSSATKTYDEYTYINVRTLLSVENGTYEIIVNGYGYFEYNGTTYDEGDVCTVTLNNTTPILIKLASKDGAEANDTNVMLIIRRAAA